MYTVYADGAILYQSDIGDAEYFLGSPEAKFDIGKVSSFNFTIFPTHPEYENIIGMKTRIKVTEDGSKIRFIGRVLDVTAGMYKEKQCVCEDALAFLNDSWIGKMEKTKMTPIAFFRKCIEAHNSSVGADKKLILGNVTLDKGNEEADFEISNYSCVMNIIDQQLIDIYGGYLQIRYDDSDDSKIYVDYIQRFSDTIGQTIEFAKNLIDLENNLEGSDVFSALVATGKDGVTIGEAVGTQDHDLGNGVIIHTVTGDPVITIPAAVAKYGYVTRVEQFGNKETAAEVFSEAKAYLLNNYHSMPNTLNIKAIDMHLLNGSIDEIWAGKKVRIVSNPHGIDEVLLCQAVQIDIQNPENTSYEFGDPTQQTSYGSSSNGSTSASSKSATGGSRSLSGATGGIGSHCLWDGEDIDISKHEIILRAEENMLLEAKTMELKAKDLLIDTSMAQVWTNAFLVMGGELTEKEGGLKYPKGADTPIADAKGNPIYIAPNGKMIQYGEDGLPKMTEDGKFLDSDGNPVDPADCTVNQDYSQYQLLKQANRLNNHLLAPDGHAIKMNDDGTYVTQNGKYVDTEGHLWDPDECSASPITIAALNSDVVVLGGALTDYQVETAEALADHQRTMTAINSDVILLRSDLTADELEIAKNGTSITKLGSDVTLIRADLTADEATLASHGTSITKLGSDVILLRSDLTADEATLAEHGTKITKIGSDVTVIGGDLSEAEAELVRQGNSITSINSKITNINSDIVNIKGTLTADWVSARIAEINHVSVKSLGCSGSMDVRGTLTANSLGYGSMSGFTNVANFLMNVSKSESNGTVTLTFSRGPGSSATAPTVSFKTAGSVTVSGSWSSGTFTAKASNGVSSWTETLIKGSETWNGTTCSFPVNSYLNGMSYTARSTGKTFSVLCSGKLEEKSISSNGTYTPSNGKIGFSKVTVSVNTATENRTFSSNGTYYPTSGKIGMYKVVVSVNTSTEEKSISSNGTFYPSSGKIGFSKVTVSGVRTTPVYNCVKGATRTGYYGYAYKDDKSTKIYSYKRYWYYTSADNSTETLYK